MKFAHLADVHLGAWREPKMKKLVLQAFSQAVSQVLKEGVDFAIIAGDFFNTSMPGIEVVEHAVKELVRLRKAGIPVYVVPGSHDFSASGKTMLNVLEEAGLMTNVCKGEVEDGKLKLRFTIDKSGAKLTGMLGRRGALEKEYYHDLDLSSLEKGKGFKVFVFHSAIEELKPRGLEKLAAAPLSLLPKGFDYYAGGHVHVVKVEELEGRRIAYPGPLFPASFSELEELGKGGFFIYSDGDIERRDILVRNVVRKAFNAEGKSVEELNLELESWASRQEFFDSVVLVRVEGALKRGKPSEVRFKELFQAIYDKGAYYVMRNTSKLSQLEAEEVTVPSASAEELEEQLLKENAGKVKVSFQEREVSLAKELLRVLSKEKSEEEKKPEYEQRILEEALRVLKL